MDPSLLRGLIVAGRVLGEPDYIHEAVDWIDRLVQTVNSSPTACGARDR